jgi:thiazole synthase
MGKTAEIIIIGGGIVALAIALELKLKGITVTILSRNLKQAASHAAAGMLAPEAENLTGAMLELGIKSRDLYPEWINKLEQLTGENVGYWPCGILAPVYEKNYETQALWLDKEAISYYQTGLGEDVIGGYWYPEDGQVDNRSLMKALLQAVQILGIDLREGVAVEAIQQRNGRVICLRTNQGELFADQYILATGSWSSQLLPLPVRPVKGQMLALKMPTDKQLHRVLFGPSTYLVPRQDGRLIIGATSEEVGFTADNTPKGIQTLIQRAIRLYPALEDYPIEELWWGYRPGTPDELPILGSSFCDNLILATGHHRNGILLAPITAFLISKLILENKADSLLDSFSCDRFYQKPQIMPTLTNSIVKNDPVSVQDDALIIAGKQFKSRLMTGTGKYPSIKAMQQSVAASECEIVTVAVRRVQTNAPGHEGLAESLDWSKIWMLPNTAGCQTAEEAIRVARLGREMAKLLGQEDNNFVKLEVIPDSKYLLPDPIGTLQAAEQLVKEGFAVLPYINADPILAKRLEEIGCATVMPLGSPIGSGQGIKTIANIEIIIDQAKIPVVIDAGIGSPSEAALGMELGADALLINSAIALAHNPVAMAKAMGMATVAGRLAYLSGRIPVKAYASASSPLTGVIK